MSGTAFILRLKKGKRRHPVCRAMLASHRGGPMRDEKVYCRREKHKKRAEARLMEDWER